LELSNIHEGRMNTLPPDVAFDATIAQATQAPVRNGDLARGSVPVLIDIMQTAAHATLCPVMGLGGQLDTTAVQVRLVVPAFARFARPVAIAAGSGDIVFNAVSGCTGTATITVDADSGAKEPYDAGAALASADALSIDAGDIDRAIVLEVSRSSTDVVCFAFGLQIEGNFV
jgi:hypothetical protein